MFRSFFQGGFESSSHRRPDASQLDMIAATDHDVRAEEDYRLLRRAGMGTARDAVRWHLIETAPGRYDWSSWRPMLQAAQAADLQVIWDLCHYGLPHDVDIWSSAFPERFAAFCEAAARFFREHSDEVPFWCPMNEISFWAWGGGDKQYLYPAAIGRGPELKRQLIRAAIAGTAAARGVDRRARFVQAEPLINIVHDLYKPEDREPAAAYNEAQFQAWDMLCGRLDPELGGRPEYLDIVGVNYYWDNQWIHNFWQIGVGHRQHVPLHKLLAKVHDRYGRPMLIAETGCEHDNGPPWINWIGGEVRRALRLGLPVHGLCLYPVMDYPGWADDRHCRVGLIKLDAKYQQRSLDRELAMALEEEAQLFAPLLSARPEMALAAD
ncbi:MAG: beta-glucosidase [Acetobacteraceae bacterium]|nr:beta-glucosidase [Acetobacteraceae bacterium]